LSIVLPYLIGEKDSRGLKPISCPSIAVDTCGKNNSDARRMLGDAIKMLAEVSGYDLSPTVRADGWVAFGEGEVGLVLGFFLRRNRRNSLAEASEVAGLHANSLGRWERGEQSISLESLSRVLAGMNLPFELAIVGKN
jgi:hypothetical protein